jgi:hypothetical protein
MFGCFGAQNNLCQNSWNLWDQNSRLLIFAVTNILILE